MSAYSCKTRPCSRNRFCTKLDVQLQSMPPPFLTTSIGAVSKVKEMESGHKWLGCMLSAAGSKHATLDFGNGLQSASRALANK